MHDNADSVKPEFTGARWSSACRCPRMCALSLTGALAAPAGDRVRGLWQRGEDVEVAYFRDHDFGRVSRQHELSWGDGWVTHCDGVLLDDPERPHLEVKSTTKIDTLPGPEVVIGGVTTKASALQVAGQAHWDPEGGTARVVAVSPVDYAEREYPINVAALSPVVDEIERQVVHAAATGELPARQCRVPNDGIGRHCAHIAACFADYDEPEPVVLDGKRARLADVLLREEGYVKEAKAELAELETYRAETRADLRDLLEPGVDYWTDHARVRVSTVRPRITFKLQDALAAGAVTPEQVAPFVTTGAESERWLVEPISTEGDEAA